jgi:L-ascorbate metabolism protein UlaG (beta-lactamase superfamily)
MTITPHILIRWLGQSCFVLSTVAGLHVLIDPPHPDVGYAIKANSIPAQIVFVSHEHSDHNFVEAAMGSPTVVQPLTKPEKQIGKWALSDAKDAPSIAFRRVFSYHDTHQGKLYGTSTITEITINGLRVCHMGDIGQTALTPEQVAMIGPVDVLMIPVGGHFTVDGNQAVEFVNQLDPKVVIPMHYGTPALNAQLKSLLAPPTMFVNAMKAHGADIVTVSNRDLDLSQESLPKKRTVYLLRYE